MKKVIIGAIFCLLLLLIPMAAMAETETSLNVDVIADYGAAGDGETNDREAIQKAIDEVHAAGGGTVTLTAGKTFLSTNIILKSNVTLQFGDGAMLKQCTDDTAYVKPVDGGYESYTPLYGRNFEDTSIKYNHTWYSNYPFIYAGEGTTNIKITGKGIIEMTPGAASNGSETICICPIGLYRVDGYEISDLTIQNYCTYAIMPYTTNNGLIKNVTIQDAVYGSGDGISLMNSQDIRITECNITTNDDAVYIFSSYADPRAANWWSSENPQPSKNIEIDNNKLTVTWLDTKAMGFILWGAGCPDQSLVEVKNVYIHDNEFNTMGIWNNHPYDTETRIVPMTNIRFENNVIADGVQANFYTIPMSDVYGYDCMTAMRNADFETTGEAYWVPIGSAGAAKESVGQGGTWYGYIDKLDEADAKLYQGIKLEAGEAYTFTASVQSSGVACRLYVRDQVSQELIASKEFSNTSWAKESLTFVVPTTGNYHIGIERGNASEGWARIDSASLELHTQREQTVFTNQLPTDFDTEYAKTYDLGMRFSTKVSGEITKVRIYTNEETSGKHIIRIWNYGSETVLAGPYEWDVPAGTLGWQEFTLPEPLYIDANTHYMVSVTNGENSNYARGKSGTSSFAAAICNGDLVTYVGSGYYTTTPGSMPNKINQNYNYFRDIVFQPSQTVYTTQTPTDYDTELSNNYDLGMRFMAKMNGQVTRVRIYTHSSESGVHTVRLWDYATKTLIAGPYEWDVPAGTEGWQEFELPEPLTIEAGKDYMVSVTNGNKSYYARGKSGTNTFNEPICNRDLVTYVGSGYYTTSIGSMPASSNRNYSYFRDIIFKPAALDKSALKATVESCSDFDENKYKAEFWAPFEAALTQAQKLLAWNDDATDQLEVNTANQTLQTAIVNLADGEIPTGVDVIADYGAAGDGVTDDRAAIQKAIDEMYAAGGGTVILTEGKTFLSGNIILRSNVTLHFGDGAVLKQNPDQGAYVKPEGDTLVAYTPDLGHNTIEGVRWGHSFFKNYPLIYAGEGTTNIKISGAGTIEMTPARNSDYSPAEFCADTIHLCPLGLYRVSDFTVQDITITNSSAYGMMVFTCNNGLIKNITMKDFIHTTYDVDDHLNGDGISMQNCQDMRVTGCDLTVSDDALYIWTSYNDPRGGTWWSSENPQPSKNFEIDNNKTSTTCKGFGFILWGSSCPDQYKVEVSNVYVHGNTFSSLGIWPDDPHDTLTDPTPIKNIRFENNTIAKIQDNFYSVPISNMSGYASMTEIMNGGFENTETYWIIDKDESYAANAAGTSTYSCGQDGSYFGYMQNLVEGKNISIYQGLWLDAGRVYTFSAKLMTKGNTCRMFVRNLDTQEVIATQDFNNTAWEEKSMTFTVLNSGNYQVGIESGESTTGMARIDSASLTSEVDPTQTIFTTQVPDGFGSDSYYELGTRFTTSANGRVTKVRIYTTATESGIHYVRLWDYKNKTAITPVYEWDVPAGTEGWQEFTLPTPVSLSAGVEYVVAVSNNATNKLYPKDNDGLASQVSNGNLVAYAKGGLWSRTQGDMPYNQANTNYFRDIVFEATEQSIFSTETPTGTGSDTFYELGTRFKAARDGYVTQVRIYTTADESGVHTVRLWDYQNKTLLAGPYEWDVPSGVDGWQYFTLPTPLPIEANTDYVVSVSNNASNKLYSKGDDGLASAITNGDLITYASSGLWSRNAGDMPYNKAATNYFRDIVFVLEKADRAALQLAVDSCADLVESEYSADSWAALQEALSNAKTVLADPYTTQEQADEATTALNAAIEALAAPAEPEPFKLTGASMTLGGSLAMNFVVDAANLDGDGHYAVITKFYEDGTTKSVTVAQENWDALNDSSCYFTFEGVNAKEMTDEIRVVIYNSQNQQVCEEWVDSVEAYCLRMLPKADTAEKAALYVDMLNYGAAAQAYFGYKADDLANAELTAEQLAMGTQSVEMEDIRVKGEGYYGTSLALENQILLNFVFEAGMIDNAASAKVTFTDHYGKAKEVTYQAEDFFVLSDSLKAVQVDALAVADGSQAVTCTLYDADGNVLTSAVDSMESYIARKTTSNALYETILKFSISAYNYFH